MSVQSGGRQVLVHGMVLVLVGLLWGLVVPATPYPRLALGAHIQFETNGVLFIVLATLLLKLPHRVGRKSVFVMVLSAWLTWCMALSEVANAWWVRPECYRLPRIRLAPRAVRRGNNWS